MWIAVWRRGMKSDILLGAPYTKLKITFRYLDYNYLYRKMSQVIAVLLFL